MAETIIRAEHRPSLAKMQHTLEYLQAERLRLEAEYAYVLRQGQAAQGELMAVLSQYYGIEAGALLSLDAERGVIVTRDVQAAEVVEAETEPGEAG